MKKKIGWKVTLTALVVALALATTLPGATAQAKSKVAMNKAKVTVCTGKSYTLKMSGISKKVKWSTSDKNVVSITKKSGKKAEKVTIKGNKKGTATVTAKVGKKKYKATVKVAGHKYGKVTYKWNKDYSKCTASKKCSRCGKTLKQTVKAKGKTTTKATCTETGKKKYTAQFSKYSFGTKTKSVTIKAKGHKVNSDKKISYKWNSGYSKCTATYYCKKGGEKQKESVKASKKTTPATKTSKGKVVYTATFKTKGLQAQTKKVTIPKLAYLTLNGKEVNSVTIDYAHPAKIKFANVDSDTQVSRMTVNGYDMEEPGAQAKYMDAIGRTDFYTDSAFCQSFWENTNNDWPDYADEYNNMLNFYAFKNKARTSVTFKAIPPASDKTYNIGISLSDGQTVNLKLTTKFTPGEYKFGEVDMCYHGYNDTNETPEFREYYSYTYVAYGKNKGLYTWYKRGIDSNGNGMYENTEVTITKLTKTAPDGTVTELPVDSVITTDYIMDCNTKKDYDDAYRFYHERKDRNGSICDLEQKTADIYSDCNKRANWDDDSLEKDMIKKGYDPNDIFDVEKYAEENPIMAAMILGNLYDTQGNFSKKITSQAQVDSIVTAWANEYNGGQMPSWYYPTVFSDWAEWSGRDLGLN